MKVVFWDWNGTLANDTPILCDIFNRLIHPRGGTPVTVEQYRELYRHPVRGMYEDAGVDLSTHSFDDIAHEWHEHYTLLSRDVTLHYDALPTLEEIRSRGSRQMVLSALPQDILEASVRLHGVENFFEQITGVSDKQGAGKIAEGRHLLSKTGVTPSDVTIIGDSSHDAEVAQALSTNCFLVARGAESRARLEVNGYPVLDSFAQIIEAIKP
jgi:phosphoglycolate phosphatase